MGHLRYSAGLGAAALFMVLSSIQTCSAKRNGGAADISSALQIRPERPFFSDSYQSPVAFENLLRSLHAVNSSGIRYATALSQAHVEDAMRNDPTLFDKNIEGRGTQFLPDPLGDTLPHSQEEAETADLDAGNLRNLGTSGAEVAHGTANIFEALAGGTGATSGAFGIRELDAALLHRMRCQDKAVQALLIAVYFVTLFFAASLTYRQCQNDSPLKYYADPRFHNMAAEGHDLQTFLESFNPTPKNVQLQVTGYVPVPEETGNVKWKGDHYHVAFTFALDLSPWVVYDVSSSHSALSGMESMSEKDLQKLRYFLDSNRNDLANLQLVKKVAWPGWEELATNIKHQIRKHGFSGVIGVHRSEDECVTVYKNRPWANFMYSQTTKVLCALSIFGWPMYFAYMFVRCKTTKVHSHFRVDVQINDFWQLIQDNLGADGFVEADTRA